MNKSSNFSYITIRNYDKAASEYDKIHSNVNFWLKELKLFKKIIQGRKILDIGCGTGRDALFFTKSGFKYIGIDASREMLKIAKMRIKNGNFMVMDFYKLRFPLETFDGFWAAASLLHIPKRNLPLVLRTIKNITKRNGIGFISIKRKTEIEDGIINFQRYGGTKFYFSYYDKDEFKQILEKSGFKVLRTYNRKGKGNWICYFVRNIK